MVRVVEVVRSPLSDDPWRVVEGVLLTDSPRRVTALPDSFPEVRARCGSLTVEDREDPGSCLWDRETRASFDTLPASRLRLGEATALRRFSTTPPWSRLPEVRWLG
jgi:hypothetical protein